MDNVKNVEMVNEMREGTRAFAELNSIQTVEDVKTVEEMLKEIKSTLSMVEKDEKARKLEETVELVNELIKDGSLNVGSLINCQYKNRTVKAKILTIPRLESENLSVASDDFDNKSKKIYLRKSRFIELV